MRYLVPSNLLVKWLSQYDSERIGEYTLKYDLYIFLLRRFLEPILVDTDWYLTQYPGIARGISEGRFNSPQHHYLIHGYFEGRRPFPPEANGSNLPLAFSKLLASTPRRPSREGLLVSIKHDLLLKQIKSILTATPLDEEWYQSEYPNVKFEIERGFFASGLQHFITYGYEEGKFPFLINVDECWYLTRYRDVDADIRAGKFKSAQEHFLTVGYSEGRFPGAPFKVPLAEDQAGSQGQ